MITRIQICSAASLLALAGAAVSAEVFDYDARSGDVMQAIESTVVFGPGDPVTVRRWVPVAIPDAGSLVNNAGVSVVDGDIRGAVTAWGTNYLIWYFETADRLDDNGGYTSNNVVVDEFPGAFSNTMGKVLSNGQAIFRANFAGADQNNLESLLGDVRSQQPVFPEPGAGDPILAGPGIDGQAGTAFLGVPDAQLQDNGNVWVSNTNFDSFTGDIPRGANVWDYDGTPQNSSVAAYSYSQTDAETYANANGVTIDSGDGRQTQPGLATVEDINYIIFGINDTNDGGSGRPAIMIFDAFEDGNGFTDAFHVMPPSNHRFIDHQATGGGTSVFESRHFDMNASGQFAVVAESIQSVPSYQLLLYNPIMSGDRITGFEAPALIADAGPADVIDEGLAGPILIDDGMGGFTAINAISGVSINDAGNIGFTATYDTGEIDGNGDPIWASAAYLYDGSTLTLHQVLVEGETIGHPSVGSQITAGLIAQEDSDSFFAASLADGADVLAFNFRPFEDDARGTVVIAIGHEGDADFDGDVDQSDLGTLLAVYGSTFGSPMYDPEVDFNCDGNIGQQDLGILLANYGL